MNSHDHVDLLDRLRADGALSVWRGGEAALKTRIASDTRSALATVQTGLRDWGFSAWFGVETRAVFFRRLDGRIGGVRIDAHSAPSDGSRWRAYKPLIYR